MRRSAVLLLVLLGGCTTWNVVALPAPADSGWQATGQLRLTTTDGRRLRGDSLWAAADSLMLRTQAPTKVVGVARGEVRQLELHETDKNKTVGLIIGVLALSVLVLIAVASSLSGLDGGSLLY